MPMNLKLNSLILHSSIIHCSQSYTIFFRYGCLRRYQHIISFFKEIIHFS